MTPRTTLRVVLAQPRLGVLVVTAALPLLGLSGCATNSASEKHAAPPANAAPDGHEQEAAVAADMNDGAQADEHGGKHGGKHAYTPAGHDGHHRFDDADKWASRFEDPSRDAWQKPEEVIAWMELSKTSIVADIGSATGYFPVRIAKHVEDGRVYGVDIEQAMVDYLNARAAREGLSNLTSVLGEPANPNLPEPVDVILVVNTYHHIADRPAYFARVKERVKPGGRLMIVDFKKGDLPFGPPEAMKLAPAAVIDELQAAGWNLRAQHALEHQYALVFEPASKGTK